MSEEEDCPVEYNRRTSNPDMRYMIRFTNYYDDIHASIMMYDRVEGDIQQWLIPIDQLILLILHRSSTPFYWYEDIGRAIRITEIADADNTIDIEKTVLDILNELLSVIRYAGLKQLRHGQRPIIQINQ